MTNILVFRVPQRLCLSINEPKTNVLSFVELVGGRIGIETIRILKPDNRHY